MNAEKAETARRLADEYVLGTLQGQARARFERLMREQPFLQALVQASEQHWNALAQALPPTPPRAKVWRQIRSRIAPRRRAGLTALLDSLGFWRGAALAGATAALALSAVLTLQPPADAPLSTPVNLVVVITDDARSQASWVLNARPEAGLLAVSAIAPQSLPTTRTHQLWMKLPDEAEVRSLGLIPASGRASLRLDPGLAAALPRAVKFGVSIEPEGGSPTGQPTTTPLWHGQLVAF